MRFDIMTLFPEAVDAMMQSSILGRAQKKGLIEIHTHQIRDYTTNKQNHVAKKPKQSRSCTTAEEALDPDANYTEDKGDFEIPTEDEAEESGEEDTEPI